MHWIRIGREMPPIGRFVIFSISSKTEKKNSRFNLLIGMRPEYYSTGYCSINNQYGYIGTGEYYFWYGVPLTKFLDYWEEQPILPKTSLEFYNRMPTQILVEKNDYWTHIEDINPVRTVLFDKDIKAFKYDEELIQRIQIIMQGVK